MTSDMDSQWHLAQHEEDVDTYRAGCNIKIVLNRPRNGNALTKTMVSRLTTCFRDLASDRTVSRIIITAEGKFFCTGMDLGTSSTAVGKGDDETLAQYRMFIDLFRAIEDAPQVTIAAINGPCYAGGVGLAFACDLRLAVASASVTLSEVRLGLCPAIISRYLVREWGVSFAREAMLTGRTIPMTELAAVKAVHGLARDRAGLEQLLDTTVRNLGRCAPGASALCKKVAAAGWTHAGSPEHDRVLEGIFAGMMRPGGESAVGLEGFRSKKPVDWDGLVSKL